MAIPVACSCGRTIRAPDKLAGKRVKCPDCGQIVAIPEEGASPSEPETPPSAPASRPPARAVWSNSPPPAASKAPQNPAPPPAAAPPPAGHPQHYGQPPPGSRPGYGVPPPGYPAAPGVPMGQGPMYGQPGYPPGMPAGVPPPATGTGALLNEQMTLDFDRARKEALESFVQAERQKELDVYMAPRAIAEKLRRRTVHGPLQNAKPLDLNKALTRSWRLYTGNFGLVIGGFWLVAAVYLPFVTLVVGIVIGLEFLRAWLHSEVDLFRDVPELATYIVVRIIEFVLVTMLASIAEAGIIRFYLRMARGWKTKLSHLMPHGRHFSAVFSISMLNTLIWILPALPMLMYGLVLSLLYNSEADFQRDWLDMAFPVKVLINVVLYAPTILLGLFALDRWSQWWIAKFVAIDFNIFAEEALDTSGTGMWITNRFWWLVLNLIIICGVLATLCVGVIPLVFSLPWAWLLLTCGYVSIAGDRDDD